MNTPSGERKTTIEDILLWVVVVAVFVPIGFILVVSAVFLFVKYIYFPMIIWTINLWGGL